jgi:hypothetical protein
MRAIVCLSMTTDEKCGRNDIECDCTGMNCGYFDQAEVEISDYKFVESEVLDA